MLLRCLCVFWLTRRAVLPEDKKEAAIELAVYLEGSVGNSTRLDYGTGHETAFVVFMLVIDELKLFAADDYQCVALMVFARYLKLVRAFQRQYMLEVRHIMLFFVVCG